MPLTPDSYRQPRLQAPVPVPPAAPARDPRLRFDRITALPRPNTEGQVLTADRRPHSRAQLLFVSTDRGVRQTVAADEQGRFQTNLIAGTWLIYLQNAAGQLVYQQRLQVGSASPPAPITLVSR
jgi:hypothetical protein